MIRMKCKLNLHWSALWVLISFAFLYISQLHTELENIISGKKPVTVAPTTQETPAETTASASGGEETSKTAQKESQEDGELPIESEELKALKSELK